MAFAFGINMGLELLQILESVLSREQLCAKTSGTFSLKRKKGADDMINGKKNRGGLMIWKALKTIT